MTSTNYNGVTRRGVCRRCVRMDLQVGDAAADLRKAAMRAQSARPSAAAWAAKIPDLKSELERRKADRDDHAAECEVVA